MRYVDSDDHEDERDDPQDIDLDVDDDDDDEDSDTDQCPACRRAIYAGAPKCPYCGEWLFGDSPAADRGRRWFWPIMVALLIAVILVMWHGLGR